VPGKKYERKANGSDDQMRQRQGKFYTEVPCAILKQSKNSGHSILQRQESAVLAAMIHVRLAEDVRIGRSKTQ